MKRDSDSELKRARLIEAGIIRPGKGDARVILETPPLEVPTSILEALKEERADRV
jgi:hypothetical protein